MTTLTIEISDTCKEFLDREVASGRFKDTSALVQVALDRMMRYRLTADAEMKIEEALDEYERGEFTVWQKGDFEKRGLQHLHEKHSREAKS
jgi:Arc/MetJ-type ribon-helix-helix transcriptional regulator